VRLIPTEHYPLALLMGADEALLIADACRSHAEYVDDGTSATPQSAKTEGALFRTLGFAFDLYAQLEAVQGCLTPAQQRETTLATVRRE